MHRTQSIDWPKSVMHAPEVISCVFIAFVGVGVALFQLMRNEKKTSNAQIHQMLNAMPYNRMGVYLMTK